MQEKLKRRRRERRRELIYYYLAKTLQVASFLMLVGIYTYYQQPEKPKISNYFKELNPEFIDDNVCDHANLEDVMCILDYKRDKEGNILENGQPYLTLMCCTCGYTETIKYKWGKK